MLIGGQFIDPRQDLWRGHLSPLVTIVRQHRIECVTPAAAIIAPCRTHKNGRTPDERTLSLNGRAENFTDADPFGHGRYSAQVRGVSQTRTAMVSGQRSAHQS